MSHLRLASLILIVLGGVAIADVQPPATRPSKPIEGYRLLGHGSWIVSQAMIRTTPGFPAQVKRKITVADQPIGRRTLEEATWTGTTYEVNAPAQALAPADPRTFDEMGFTPQGAPASEVLFIARDRYPCSAFTYEFEDKTRKETTRFTLFRDKTQTVSLPPRTMSLGGQTIPLPSDAIAVDFETQGIGVLIKGQRRVLFLTAPLQVGQRTCACVVETVRSNGTRSGKAVSSAAREWHCHDLPGEKLKSTSTANLGTVKLESDMTVLDFHIAPLAAAKGPTTRAVGE